MPSCGVDYRIKHHTHMKSKGYYSAPYEAGGPFPRRPLPGDGSSLSPAWLWGRSRETARGTRVIHVGGDPGVSELVPGGPTSDDGAAPGG